MTENSHELIPLGITGPKVFPLGLGCMGFSGMYGATDDAESIATIHAAVDAGITLIDTGDFYGMGHNEMLLGRALVGKRDRVQLSVKFGAMRAPDGAFVGFDARPAAVKNFASYSLKRLGVEVIDIYRPARLDSAVPIEDTIGAIVDLIKAGYVRHIGLSEVRETRQVLAKVGLAGRFTACQEAAREDAVQGRADAGLLEQRENLGFRATGNQRIFDLQIDDRVHALRAADRLDATAKPRTSASSSRCTRSPRRAG